MSEQNKNSLAKQYSRVRDFVENADALGCDYLSLLSEINDLKERARQGIATEKICAGMGAVPVIETFPTIEQACIRMKFDILKDAVKALQNEEPPDTTVILNIVRETAKPEDA